MISDAHSYHHGDLRSALVEAGLRLARDGGVNALGLRELTRSVGVTPNAAYRHFADRQALVLAVAAEAQNRLARAIRERLGAIPGDADPAERAVHQLREVSLGYIHFAVSEPGWFELAFLMQDESRGDECVTIDDYVPPYQFLLDALDGMVHAGVLTPERRADAEWVCWSGVHGIADLATRGPLQGLDRSVIDMLAARVVDTTLAGLRT
ncbi:TetR/AcrR family transcriptional regulator [Micromonospora sp. NPDC049523]|uniref:TetR/AcrR family transcriptional regulator n=1 Tax=Micromonospora sp. NPDC049523 TaxID=3155921 RepID=UPI00343809CF